MRFEGSFGKHAQHSVHLQQEIMMPCKATQQAEVIVSAQAPYRINSVNDAWVELLGFRCVAPFDFVRTGAAQNRSRSDCAFPVIMRLVAGGCRGCAAGGVLSKRKI